MKKLILALLMLSSQAFAGYKITGLSDVTVTTGGTRVQMSSTAILSPSVCIEAKSDNSGKLFIGGSDVTSSKGIELAAGQSICLDASRSAGYDMIDLSTIWINASANTQVAKVIYYSFN